ncbi:MAG: hypothetical protein SFW66_02950 [Gammaproteobacteria bacterium]|nr:hypothetical protein [Gammaproteobacteria bacterium]
MQNKCILTHSYFSELSSQRDKKPRKRFMDYYQDLFFLRNQAVNHESFYIGGQYSYTELADAVLVQYQTMHDPKELQLIALVIWSHEFDPDYASCTAYIAHAYGIQVETMDFCDNGLLGLHVSLYTLQKYMQRKEIQVAILLVLEQTTIPHGSDRAKYYPKHNFACAIRMKSVQQSHIQSGDVIVERSEILHEQSTLLLQSAEIYQNVSNKEGYYPAVNMIHQWIQKKNLSTLSLFQKDCESNSVGYLHLRRAS